MVVQEEIIHPEYDDFELPYDFMILKLEAEVTNPVVSFAGLAGDSTTISPNESLTVMGYGYDFFMELTDQLKFVNVPFVDDATCVDLYSNHPFLEIDPERMICAGDLVNGGVDSCWGDSGKFGMKIFAHCRFGKRKSKLISSHCYNRWPAGYR